MLPQKSLEFKKPSEYFNVSICFGPSKEKSYSVSSHPRNKRSARRLGMSVNFCGF